MMGIYENMIYTNMPWSAPIWKIAAQQFTLLWSSYHKKLISYTWGREYRVAENRYSWLLFTSELMIV